MDLNIQNGNSNSKINEYENQKRIIENEQVNLQNQLIELGKVMEKISPDLPNMRKESDEKRKDYNKVHLTLNTFNTYCRNKLCFLYCNTK